MVKRSRRLRLPVVLALTVCYCLLVLVYGHRIPSKSLYSPLAYLAIVLSALWWGRKGALMAGVFALAGFAPRLWHVGIPDFWGDVARSVSFFVVAGGLGMMRDRAVQAFHAKRESDRKYQDIVEKSLAGIFVYRDERVLYTNSRLKELVGIQDEDLAGWLFWEFILEEDKPKVRARLAGREAGITSDLHYQCRLARRDGHTVWVDVVSARVEYEGKPAILVNMYDITQQKEIERRGKELSRLARRQEEQLVHSTRLAEMGEMAAGIAHELNQPLTGIKNYAKNAMYMIEQEMNEPEELKGNLQLISTQVDRASKIIGQMRELARRSERQFAPVDVNQKLRETVEFVMPQMRLSGVEVTLNLASGIPQVMGDGLRLEQVFLNLLTNARQAMEDTHERCLAISSRHEPQSDRPVVIEIRDTGKGFPPESAQRLFAPFYTTKQSRHGTGLGLSISLGIIEDHRGVIQAQGEPGRGAAFTVRLPAHDSREMETTPIPETEDGISA